MKRKFSVYFEQVNQSRYDVEAPNRGTAYLKAKRLWKHDNAQPIMISIEEREQEKEKTA